MNFLINDEKFFLYMTLEKWMKKFLSLRSFPNDFPSKQISIRHEDIPHTWAGENARHAGGDKIVYVNFIPERLPSTVQPMSLCEKQNCERWIIYGSYDATLTVKLRRVVDTHSRECVGETLDWIIEI